MEQVPGEGWMAMAASLQGSSPAAPKELQGQSPSPPAPQHWLQNGVGQAGFSPKDPSSRLAPARVRRVLASQQWSCPCTGYTRATAPCTGYPSRAATGAKMHVSPRGRLCGRLVGGLERPWTRVLAPAKAPGWRKPRSCQGPPSLPFPAPLPGPTQSVCLLCLLGDPQPILCSPLPKALARRASPPGRAAMR